MSTSKKNDAFSGVNTQILNTVILPCKITQKWHKKPFISGMVFLMLHLRPKAFVLADKI